MSLLALPDALLQTLLQSLRAEEIVAVARCCRWTLRCADSALAWRLCPTLRVSFHTAEHFASCSRLLRRVPLSLAWSPVHPAASLLAVAASLRVLDLDCNSLRPAGSPLADVETAFAHPAMQQVRSLTLRCTPTSELMRAIASLSSLTSMHLDRASAEIVPPYDPLLSAPRLTHLRIADFPGQRPAHSCMSTVVKLQHLRRLSLVHVGATARHFRAFCSRPVFSLLERLTLKGCTFGQESTSVSQDYADGFAAQDYADGFAALRSLQVLTLDQIRPTAFKTLLPQLHHAPALRLLCIEASLYWPLPDLAPVLAAMPGLQCQLSEPTDDSFALDRDFAKSAAELQARFGHRVGVWKDKTLSLSRPAMSLSKPAPAVVAAAASPSSDAPAAADPTLWQQYLTQLVKNPIRTKALTSGATSALATILAQLSLGVPVSSLNWTSVRNQTLLGLIRGPTIHAWMEMLTRLFDALGFKTPAAQASPPAVLGKMACDQLLFAPLHMLYYFFAIGLLEGRSTAETQVKLSREYLPLMKLNWSVWPAVQVINFKYLPPHLRVLFANVVGIGYMTFLVRTMAKAAAAAAQTAQAVAVIVK